jgi:outer membrane protein
MKKVLLTLSFIGIAAISQAQLAAGQIAIGGSLGFTAESSTNKTGAVTVDGPKTTSFNIMPSVGYLVTDKIEIGLGIGYAMTSREETLNNNKDVRKFSTSVFAIMPYARYYMMMAGNVGFFGQAGISFASGTAKTEITPQGGPTTSTSSDISAFGLGVSPGIIYFMNDKIAIEAAWGALGYNRFSEKMGDDETITTIGGLDLNTSTLKFGFRYYIGGGSAKK